MSPLTEERKWLGSLLIFCDPKEFFSFLFGHCCLPEFRWWGESTKIIVSGPLGQTTGKPTENFCGVAESLVHAADVCSWFPGLFRCQASHYRARLCPNFSVGNIHRQIQTSIYHGVWDYLLGKFLPHKTGNSSGRKVVMFVPARVPSREWGGNCGTHLLPSERQGSSGH